MNLLACGNLVVIGWKEHSLPFGEVQVSDRSIDGSVFDFRGTSFFINHYVGDSYPWLLLLTKRSKVYPIPLLTTLH